MKKIGVLYFMLLVFTTCFTFCSAQQNGPAEVYDLYLASIKSADSLDDLYPYITSRKKSSLESIPEENKPGSLQFKKNVANSTERKNIKTNINDNQAKLIINAVDTSSKKNVVVTVTMLKEGGNWKVDEEVFDFTIADN